MSSGIFRLRSTSEATCASLAEGLSAYVDGAIDAVARAAIENHLRACAPCARELEQIRQVAEAARVLARHVPAERVWKRVQSETGGAAAAEVERRAERIGARGWIPAALLYLYDADLVDRIRETGTCRERHDAAHGVVATVAAVLLGALPLMSGRTELGLAALALVPVVWLASTRLDSRWSAPGILLLTLLAAAPPLAVEAFRQMAHAPAVTMALPAAAAALAAAQVLALGRLRPRVFGSTRVPAVVRLVAVLAVCVAAARPDLTGALSLAPAAFGAAAGTLAGRMKRKAA